MMYIIILVHHHEALVKAYNSDKHAVLSMYGCMYMMYYDTVQLLHMRTFDTSCVISVFEK